MFQVSAGTTAEKTLWLAELSKAATDIKSRPHVQLTMGTLKNCSEWKLSKHFLCLSQFNRKKKFSINQQAHRKKVWKLVALIHRLVRRLRHPVAIQRCMCAGIEERPLVCTIIWSQLKINYPVICYVNLRIHPAGRSSGWSSHHFACSFTRITRTNLHWLVFHCWGKRVLWLKTSNRSILRFVFFQIFSWSARLSGCRAEGVCVQVVLQKSHLLLPSGKRAHIRTLAFRVA